MKQGSAHGLHTAMNVHQCVYRCVVAEVLYGCCCIHEDHKLAQLKSAPCFDVSMSTPDQALSLGAGGRGHTMLKVSGQVEMKEDVRGALCTQGFPI